MLHESRSYYSEIMLHIDKIRPAKANLFSSRDGGIAGKASARQRRLQQQAFSAHCAMQSQAKLPPSSSPIISPGLQKDFPDGPQR
mmetsp:Transcript_89990/g.162328  ORF Transcript_89990/g.162328 Transcript_89990/m.162328 type:complete len:85 (+) Transcript_89990:179-433(+)